MRYKKRIKGHIFIFAIKGLEYRHKKPHVHVEYKNDEIVISLTDFEILAGNIKRLNDVLDFLVENTNFVKELKLQFYKENPHLKNDKI